MINRTLLRIKVIQTLYSFYKGDGKSIPVAQKEFAYSLEKTYDLYFHLLQLSIEVTRYAADRIGARKNKLCPTEEDLHPNMRFVENAFVRQLADNEQLNDYLSERKLSWVNYSDLVKKLYEQIVAADFYQEYMQMDASDYAADKDVWKKIYKKVLLESDELDEAIEEQSIYWVDDLTLLVSFIIKTIKRFELEAGEKQELLPMFKDDDDRLFGEKLLAATLKNGEEYLAMIKENTHNWDLDRIAFMDILIMQTALAELCNFPTIPVNVTLNEYIEISKNYSTEKSGVFINGVLDNIVNRLKSENKLIKVVSFSV